MKAIATVTAVLALSTGLFAQEPDLSKLRPTRDNRITVRFVDSELRDVLGLIAETHGLRVEFAPEVNPRTKIISLTLKGVTPITAIDMVLKQANVSAVVVDETTLRVVPKQ
jgi:type II secretory pathway component GspD/PulD (secretin)